MRGAIVRKLDQLGRVVIPVEVRRTLGIEDGSPIEMFLDGEMIVLGAYRPGCALCGVVAETRQVRGRPVCERCALEASVAFAASRSEVAATREVADGRLRRDRREAEIEQAAREWVERELVAKGWQVDASGRAGKSVDLVAWTQTRMWYVKVATYEGDEPEWPSGHELGWLNGAARRKDATAVVAFVRVVGPNWSVSFWSGHARRELGA